MTINDLILDALLQKDFSKVIKVIAEHDVPYEANLILRINAAPKPRVDPDGEHLVAEESEKELVGFYVRADIENIHIIAKILSDLYIDHRPFEILGILREGGQEIHYPLKG